MIQVATITKAPSKIPRLNPGASSCATNGLSNAISSTKPKYNRTMSALSAMATRQRWRDRSAKVILSPPDPSALPGRPWLVCHGLQYLGFHTVVTDRDLLGHARGL